MNKAKHRLLTPNELAEQRKALQQAQLDKLLAVQKRKAEAQTLVTPTTITPQI